MQALFVGAGGFLWNNSYINNSVDLDNAKKKGGYLILASAAIPILGSNGGILIVTTTLNYILQVVFSLGDKSSVFYRTLNSSGVWRNWFKIDTIKIVD